METMHRVPMHTDLKIKKIAVLTDFSQNADAALKYAAIFARAHRASLILAHAYLPLSCAYAAPESSLVLQAFEDWRNDLQKRLLRQTEADYLRDIKCRTLVRIGAPKDLLEDLRDVDLVVVGTSGGTGTEKAVMGSTAETIFRSSTVPVLTVGPNCHLGDAEKAAAFKTVLYPTDLSAGAAVAVPYALSIAKEHDSDLLLLYVVEEKDVAFSFERAMAGSEPLERLQKLLPGEVELKHKPQYLIGFGVPEKMILEEEAKHHAQLIVMGARGTGTFGSIVSRFGGGTAYNVAAKAHCPVLTIRE